MDVRAAAIAAIGADAVGGGDEAVHAQQPLAIPCQSRRRRCRAADGPRSSTKSKRTATSTAPSARPEQTAIAQFWNANAVNQSNQAFQDVAITHQMDVVAHSAMCSQWAISSTPTPASPAGTPSIATCSGVRSWRSEMPRSTGIPRPRPIPTGRRCSRHRTTPNTRQRTPASPEPRPRCTPSCSGRTTSTSRSTGPPTAPPTTRRATHTFKTVNDLQREVANARVWAGLHYRGSALEGLELARDVARWTLRRYFQPTS